MLKNIAEFSAQTESGELSSHQAVAVLDCMLEGLPKAGRILLVPPDITRCYSYGGVITSYLYHRLSRDAKVRIMPAVGTHRAMSREEQIRFFGEDVPEDSPCRHGAGRLLRQGVRGQVHVGYRCGGEPLCGGWKL